MSMKFGFHLSIAGGLFKAMEAAKRTGCEAGQIFSRNPRSWKSKPITHQEAETFRRARVKAGLSPLALHLPYLPNFGSSKQDLFSKSVESLQEEMHRADLLSAEYVVAHPGHAARDEREEESMDRVSLGVAAALAGYDGRALLLLETTSGQRGELGASFDQLALMIKGIESITPSHRVGVCLDTAHIFAAGYDISTATGLEKVISDFDSIIGLDRLMFIHLNDSKYGLGERRDRHEAVGRGKIGARGMARLVRHPSLSGLAGVMETPKADEADDIANMKRAKRWRRGS